MKGAFMKRIVGLILVLGISLSFALFPMRAFATPPVESYYNTTASFRMYRSQSITDEYALFHFAITVTETPSPVNYKIAIKNGDNTLVLGEYTTEKRIKSNQTDTILYMYFGLHKYWDVYCFSRTFYYEIPMEFFEGDSGFFEILIDDVPTDYNIILDDIAYEKRDGRIYFSFKDGGWKNAAIDSASYRYDTLLNHPYLV